MLVEAGLDPRQVSALIDGALAEDLADGVDVTSVATIPPGQVRTLDLVARAPGVVAGLPVAAAVFEMVAARQGRRVDCSLLRSDGDQVAPADRLLSITGSTHDLLVGERTALNLLCHLSGIATVTRMWVEALDGTGTRVRDTRKTTPGLRGLEKYAVRVAGGVNHRIGLFDEALIKDNHVLAAGSVGEAYRAVRRRFPDLPVEVEVDDLVQLREALAAGAKLVLLDNFPIDDLRRAVALARESTAVFGVRVADGPPDGPPDGISGGFSDRAAEVRLEASGGLRLEDAPAVAATGVDYIAVGGLTHSAPALDIGADLRPV